MRLSRVLSALALRHVGPAAPSRRSRRRKLLSEQLEHRNLLATLYVNDDAGGLNNGGSWDDAYTNLQTALATAANGDEIWVAAGTYKPTAGTDRAFSFNLKSGVSLYGGFAGGETDRSQRDWVTNVTTLSGDIGTENVDTDNSYNVVRASYVSSAVLDGFIVTAGYAVDEPGLTWDDHGAGIHSREWSSLSLANLTITGNSAAVGGGILNAPFSSMTLTNVIITGNSATGQGGGMENLGAATLSSVTLSGNSAVIGGGLNNYGTNAIATLTNVAISGNSARSGGGIYNAYGSATLTNVTLSGNSATNFGGGIYNLYGSPTLTNVILSGNTATNHDGGGIFNNHGSPILTNVTLSGNSATNYGGGIYNGGSSPTLTNVTLSGNAAGLRGGGIFNSSSTPMLTNSILWGNTAGVSGSQIQNASSTTTVSFSIVQDGWTGTGNVHADPLFARPPTSGSDGTWGTADDDYGDLRLQAGSPAINAGNSAAVPLDLADLDGDGDKTEPAPLDLDLLPRLVGPSVDMGAYEFQSVNTAPVAIDAEIGAFEDGAAVVTGILADDADGDDDPNTLLYAILTQPGEGSVTSNGDGTFTFDPGTAFQDLAAEQTRIVSFTFQATDRHGAVSNIGAVTVTVTGVNDAPVAGDDAATTYEDAAVSGNVLTNDSDVDAGDVLSVVAVNGNPAGVGQAVATASGRVTLHADGSFTYTPGAGCEATSDSFTYTVSDGNGETATATVTITIDHYAGVALADGILRVGGTAEADVVTVSGESLIVNGVWHSLAGVTEVRIWGREGDDQIDLTGLTVISFVHGGQGNDVLTGGSAEDVIFGGDGDDMTTGGAGHDYLIGGAGQDRLVGASGNDILVAGDVSCSLSLPMLRDISRAWAQSRTTTEETVEDSTDDTLLTGDDDKLTGGSGADWFIIGSEDKITDYHFDKPKTNKDGDVVTVVA